MGAHAQLARPCAQKTLSAQRDIWSVYSCRVYTQCGPSQWVPENDPRSSLLNRADGAATQVLSERRTADLLARGTLLCCVASFTIMRSNARLKLATTFTGFGAMAVRLQCLSAQIRARAGLGAGIIRHTKSRYIELCPFETRSSLRHTPAIVEWCDALCFEQLFCLSGVHV